MMKMKKMIKLGISSWMILMLGVSMAIGQELSSSDKVVTEASKIVATGHPQMVNRIEIQIGNEIITTVEIEAPLTQLQQYLKQEFRGQTLQEKMEIARKQHIKKLIEGKLLLLEARHQEVEIQDALVKENAEKEVDQLKAKFPSNEDFRRQLALEHLNEYELLRQREKLVRENLMRQKLLQQKLREFKTGAEISDDQLKEYYEDNKEKFHSPARAHVNQVFVKRPSTTLGSDQFLVKDNQAKAKITQAKQDLTKGKAFTSVARSYSEHKLSAERGGDIGWIEAGDMGLPELEKAIFESLNVGEVSKVLDTARGYFLIKIIDRQAGKTLPFEEVRGRIRQNFMAEGSEKRYNSWMDTLKTKYKVSYAQKK